MNVAKGNCLQFTHVVEELPFVLQETSVISPFCNCLRAPEIQIHSLAVILRQEASLCEDVRIIGTKLKQVEYIE